MVVIKEVEHGTMSGLESVDETEIFSGVENSLVMNQTYTHTFQCNFELSFYPFDTQVMRYSLLFLGKFFCKQDTHGHGSGWSSSSSKQA